MNLTNSRYQQLAPYLIFLFIVTVFFAIASVFPYRIEYDPLPQIKGINQWLSGGASLINSVVTVNPKDISQDIQTWIVWHATGVTFAFLPLIALGLPLGIAVRTTAYFLFVSGGLGWIKVIDTLTSDQTENQNNYSYPVIYLLYRNWLIISLYSRRCDSLGSHALGITVRNVSVLNFRLRQ